jgi:hypothetical protein
MTVKQPNVIDFVAHDPTSDEALLVMVQDEPWGESGLQLPFLEDKFNTYFSFVCSGELERSYPALRGKTVHIQVHAVSSPSDREVEFFRIVSMKHLQPAGMKLSWKVIGDDR